MLSLHCVKRSGRWLLGDTRLAGHHGTSLQPTSDQATCRPLAGAGCRTIFVTSHTALPRPYLMALCFYKLSDDLLLLPRLSFLVRELLSLHIVFFFLEDCSLASHCRSLSRDTLCSLNDDSSNSLSPGFQQLHLFHFPEIGFVNPRDGHLFWGRRMPCDRVLGPGK